MNQFMRTRTATLLILALLYGAPLAAEMATIELTDGSTLQGELLSLKDGAYEIKTQSLGVLQIPQGDVALVSYKTRYETAKPAGAASPDSTALSGLQQQMIGNPETLSLILGLGNDPMIQAVISDPEIKAAIASGDFEMLMAHPKIQQMMRHPTVRKITSSVNP
ncbi:MAG: hypothetical protein OES38_12015 [Gammaproteobacteria bacterium]|nr:hypothetical protein [Gammaproteobacteria bacterium]